MRQIKLTGREMSLVRAMGFTETMLGSEILEVTRMEPDDVGDALNGLIAAGFVETTPYQEEVALADLAVTGFEINPAYASDLRTAMQRR